MDVIEPVRVIGVGVFAEQRARAALADTGLPIGRILHPSPASPVANRGWAEQAEKQLAALGQTHLTFAALEHWLSDGLFEVAEPRGDRRLRQV